MKRTQNEIIKRIEARKERDMFGFEWQEYVAYLDYEHAKTYLKEDSAHPVLTFPYLVQNKKFPQDEKENLIGEIIICYPQVSLHAANQDKEINKIIAQFLNHAVTVLANELRKVETKS